MLSGHRSAWRRRSRSRAARIAVPLAIPMALGLTLGIVLAISSGNTTHIAQSALGASASPSASGSVARGRGGGAPRRRPRVPPAAASATAAAATAANFTVPPVNAANRAGLAGANAVDAAGNAFSLNQNAAQAAASMNCTVAVPANPLSAQGLATPWVARRRLLDGERRHRGPFVEATILSPNGQLQVYNPLVINAGHHAGRRAGGADDRARARR